MKKSKAIQLILMGAMPVAIVGCGDDKTEVRSVKKTDRFDNVKACVDSGINTDICTQSYMVALKNHKEIAPLFENKESCEADFMPDYCVATDDGKFMPKMTGFSLTSEKRQIVDRSTGQPVVTQNTDSNGFITGMLLGNLMSGNGGTTYVSDPVYRHRDSQGNSSYNTLNGFASSGIRPSHSIQEKVKSYSNASTNRTISSNRYQDNDVTKPSTASGYPKPSSSYTTPSYNPGNTSSYSSQRNTNPIGSSYSQSSYGSKSYSSPSSTKSASASSISRGGFGSASTARSGWGSSYGG
ncbi:DUF1190 domain-containing protein [Pseudomonas luteola]